MRELTHWDILLSKRNFINISAIKIFGAGYPRRNKMEKRIRKRDLKPNLCKSKKIKSEKETRRVIQALHVFVPFNEHKQQSDRYFSRQ